MRSPNCTYSLSSVAPPTESGRGPLTGRLSRFVFALVLGAAGAAAQTDVKFPAGYVGAEACAACHEDVAKAYAKNPHHALDANKKRGWEGRSCEGCHGPGAKHAESASAEDIINPKKLPARDADKRCLSCHLNQPTQVGRINSGHALSQVPCTACHEIHATGQDRLQTKYLRTVRLNEHCASCHTPVWAEFQKPHRHRVQEGAVACTDCHNPHGSFNARNQKTANANEPGCFKCHSDKRGPFIFQHAPVRNEPCSMCHEAHGSANPRMLTRAQVGFQCLECHSNIQAGAGSATLGGVPPAFHDLRSPRYQNCTVCHQKIHGSNVNKAFLR